MASEQTTLTIIGMRTQRKVTLVTRILELAVMVIDGNRVDPHQLVVVGRHACDGSAIRATLLDGFVVFHCNTFGNSTGNATI